MNKNSFYPKFVLLLQEASPPEKTAAEKLAGFFNLDLKIIGSSIREELFEEDLIVVGSNKTNPVINELFEKDLLNFPEDWSEDSEEGMLLKSLLSPYAKNKRLIAVSGSGPRGVLYSAYTLIEKTQINKAIQEDIHIAEEPGFKFRAYWVPFGMSEAFMGGDLFTWDLLRKPEGTWFEDLISLISSYRANAYILGATGGALFGGSDVQAMTEKHACDLNGVANLTSRYGLDLYLAFRFENQEWIRKEEEAGDPYPFCPYNPRITSYWQELINALHQGCPQFKGVVLKGSGLEAKALWNCSCDKCQRKPRLQRMIDSFVMIHNVLKEFNKKLIYRTWQSGNTDDEYKEFAPLAGKIPKDIIIHTKTGFWDHMAFAAPHPLIGKIYPANDAVALFDGTAEYTAGNRYPNCMVERWKETVKYCEGKVSGFDVWFGCCYPEENIADFKEKMNPLSFINWYGIGRLMWNPDEEVDVILNDWIRLKYGENVVPCVKDLLKKSADWCDHTFQMKGLSCVRHAQLFDNFSYAETILGCIDRPNIATRGDGMLGYERDIGVFPTEMARQIIKDPRLRMFFIKEKITPQVRDEALREKDQAVSLCQLMLDDWEKTKGHIEKQAYQRVWESLEKALNDTKIWRDWTAVYFNYKLGKLTIQKAAFFYENHKGKKRSDLTLDRFESFVVDVAKRIPQEKRSSKTLFDKVIEKTRWETLGMHLQRMDRLIEPKQVAETEKLYKKVWEFEDVTRIPEIIFTSPLYPYEERDVIDFSEWPYILPTYTEAMVDESTAAKDMMLSMGLVKIYVNQTLCSDYLPVVFADYGQGCIPTMFGCRTKFTKYNEHSVGWMDYYPPVVLPLSFDMTKELISSGLPDFGRGLGNKVLETEAHFIEKLSEYASLKKAVHISLCDMRGPFDLAHLMIGERIYKDIQDHPEMIDELLQILTETLIKFTKEQKRIIGAELDSSYQWEGYWAKGGVKITDDAAAKLPDKLYERFSQPFNEKILQKFGGGVIQIDRAGNNTIDRILKTEKLTGLSLKNSDRFHLDEIYEKTTRKKVCLILHGDVTGNPTIKTGIIRIHEAVSLKQAKAF